MPFNSESGRRNSHRGKALRRWKNARHAGTAEFWAAISRANLEYARQIRFLNRLSRMLEAGDCGDADCSCSFHQAYSRGFMRVMADYDAVDAARARLREELEGRFAIIRSRRKQAQHQRTAEALKAVQG